MNRDEIVREMVASSRQMVDGATDGRRANFEGADLSGISFKKLFDQARPGIALDLFSANFKNASLRKADLSDCLLAFADFTGADLEGANLSGASLNRAKLCNARLIDTDLSGALAYGVEIDGAVLKGLKLKGLKGDTKFDAGPTSPKKIKAAVIDAAREAAQTTDLEGLSASDPDGLQEAAEDLWHHSGIPDLEAQFDDDESSEVIHGDAMWKVFQKTAVDVLKARLKKKPAKASPARKSAPKKKAAPKKPAARSRAR